MPVGLTPKNSDEVNAQVGYILRQWTDNKESIHHYRANLQGVDLKIDPYNMSPEDETTIKSAIADLDDTLSAINTTFIERLTGLW
jgi:hypothetical protein